MSHVTQKLRSEVNSSRGTDAVTSQRSPKPSKNTTSSDSHPQFFFLVGFRVKSDTTHGTRRCVYTDTSTDRAHTHIFSCVTSHSCALRMAQVSQVTNRSASLGHLVLMSLLFPLHLHHLAPPGRFLSTPSSRAALASQPSASFSSFERSWCNFSNRAPRAGDGLDDWADSAPSPDYEPKVANFFSCTDQEHTPIDNP